MTEAQRGPWSVKGIDERAREAAREAARERGLTLGEYLNELLTSANDPKRPKRTVTRPEFDSIPGEMEVPPVRSELSPTDALRALARRIEAIEAKSTLAITGMDQSVIGLLRRLENAEQGQDEVVSHVEHLIDDVRGTHEALQDRIRRIESDETGQQSLEALKSLEEALGKLASHVYSENELAQAESEAIKGRVEAGFSDLSQRVEGMEDRVEITLAEATKRVEKAVEHAELRTQGESKHLSERFSALEEKVAARLEKVDHVAARVETVEKDVSGAIEGMENLMQRIQDRLNRAEEATNGAMKALEGSFDALDRKIEEVAEQSSPQHAEALRQQFEQRFEGLAATLQASVEKVRADLAAEIEKTARAVDPKQVAALQESVNGMASTLADTEHRYARAIGRVGEDVHRLTESVDKRLQNVEALDSERVRKVARGEIEKLAGDLQQRLNEAGEREASNVARVGEQVDQIAERLQKRILESEDRSAKAIEQVGEQVAGVAMRLKSRQDQAFRTLSEKLDEQAQRTDTRLTDALDKVNAKLDQTHREAQSGLSPVQKAMASLVSRIEALEEGTARRPEPEAAPNVPLPLPEDMFSDAPSAERTFPAAPTGQRRFGDVDLSRLDNWRDALDDSDDPLGGDDLDESDEFVMVTDDEDLPPEPEFGDAVAGFEDDPLSALDADEDDDPHGRSEVRDSDIFASDGKSEPEATDDGFEEGFDLEGETFVEESFAVAEEPEGDFPPVSQVTEAVEREDYLARARRAAMAAQGPNAGQAERRRSGSGMKTPLIAAASALTIAAAGGAGYFYLRGKSDDVQTASVQTTLTPDPSQVTSAASATVSSTETISGEEGIAAEDGAETLFEETETPDAEVLFEGEEYSTEEPVEEVVEAPVRTAVKPVTPLSETVTVAEAPVKKPVVAPAASPKPTVTMESAARDGNRVAQYQLGVQRLQEGKVGEATGLIEAAARAGLPAAQYRLAKLYERGQGLPRDMAEARTWTERAAEGGNTKAMHDLAVFYAEGDGGPQSYAQAAVWFRKAAEFGVVDSQFNLGVLYEQGLGVSPDLGEALYWFEIAQRNGDSMAGSRVNAVRERVSFETAQAAQRRASSFQAATARADANGNFGAQVWDAPGGISVADLQMRLTALGYDAGPNDGLMGGQTRDAVRAFQRDNGLPVTGEVDAAFVAAMDQAVSGRS